MISGQQLLRERKIYIIPAGTLKPELCAQKISGLHYALHTHHFIYSQAHQQRRIYIFQQNIKHLRSDIADIVHILAAQIPKRLRFSVRAKRMGAFFSPLNRSRWGYRSQTNKNALALVLARTYYFI